MPSPYEIKHPEWLVDAAIGSMLKASDAIVCTGFWQSGTTWLLESIAKATSSKSVFEPLLPHVGAYEEAFLERYQPHELHGSVKPGGLMPYCSKSFSEFPELRKYLQHALTGRIPGHFTRQVRPSKKKGLNTNWRAVRLIYRMQDALQTRIVVKMVRAHLILPLIISEFSPRVIHLRRDPRAVVTSYQRQSWTEWLRSAKLRDLFLTPDDGRREIYLEYEGEIDKADELGYLARIAGFWCLSEKAVDQYMDKIVLVRYESIVRHLDSYMNKVIPENFGVYFRTEDLSEESGTSNRSKGITIEERLQSWNRELNRDQVKLIEDVVTMFGMETNMRSYNS